MSRQKCNNLKGCVEALDRRTLKQIRFPCILYQLRKHRNDMYENFKCYVVIWVVMNLSVMHLYWLSNILIILIILSCSACAHIFLHM